MSVYRSARGQPIDMATLAAKNEKVRAVGNMNVNARGDVIDSYGRVEQDGTNRVKAKYAKTVKNVQTPQAPTVVDAPVFDTDGLTADEQDLFNNDDEEIKK